MIKEKISDFAFAAFYIILFPLQMLPTFAITLLEFSDPWFWIFCAAGLTAMIVQSIKFPCFNNQIFRSGAIAGFIVAWICFR